MVIPQAEIVVDMRLHHKTAHHCEPLLQCAGMKHVPVPHVETMAETRVIDGRQQLLQDGRLFLEDVLHRYTAANPLASGSISRQKAMLLSSQAWR